MKKVLLSIFLFALFAAPLSTNAAVLITEIMYDLEGSDGGYEWVEVTNMGEVPVDLGAWRLFEQGVNHKLTLFAGASSVLQPGGVALIADKPENIAARYPELEVIFDSTFSLSNETETVMLKNEAGKVVDQLTYRSSLGAKGDGASLHLVGEVLVPALPNPGVYPGELVAVEKKEEKEATPAFSLDPSLPYASAAAAPASGVRALWPWLVGLVGIIGVGVAGVLLARLEERQATKSPADEFDIVES